jgi:NTP pyrophosphatase (non-canonical NTP hydrolase)
VYKNAADHGFHDDDTKRSEVENFSIWTANLHGEVSELWEAARKSELKKPCDKHFEEGQYLTYEEEELADIVIRVFDTAVARGIDIARAIALKHAYNKTRPYKHGGKKA